MLDVLHRLWKTETGFRHQVAALDFEPLKYPVQGAFYEPNLISLIQALPWVTRRGLISSQIEQETRTISVRMLTGLLAGKSPPKTDPDVAYETFLEYGRALRPHSEYTLPNRIGFETDEEFRENCIYLHKKLSWIAATEDGIPIVYHRTWDDTYYLVNIDGANHFAAVYRQCLEQDREFSFECRIQHQWLDIDECQAAIFDCTALILPTSVALPLSIVVRNYGLRISPYCYEFQKGKSILVIGWNLFKGRKLAEIVLEVLPREVYFDVNSYVSTLKKA